MELTIIGRCVHSSLIASKQYNIDNSLTEKYGKIVEDVCREYRCSEDFALKCSYERYPRFVLDLSMKIPINRQQWEEHCKIAEENVKVKFQKEKQGLVGAN